MNVGYTLFAQVMVDVPRKTFGRIIERHNCDAGPRTLICADLIRVMTLAQLTRREYLRDIEVFLTATQAKLFHMEMKGVPACSTHPDAVDLRNWRTHHALAIGFRTHARDLCAKKPLHIDPDATVGRVYSALTDMDIGVICDQFIAINGFYVSKSHSEQVRRIRFENPETGQTLFFSTNNTALPPFTIAAM
jgi:hypothetical protein